MAAPRAAATGTPISPSSADRWSGRVGWPARRPGKSQRDAWLVAVFKLSRSAVAQERPSAHFLSGADDPTVVVARTSEAQDVLETAENAPGVLKVTPVATSADGELPRLAAVLEERPTARATRTP